MSISTAVFDSLLEPTFLLDTEGRVSYCNEAAASILDSSPKKISRCQKKFSELFHFEKDPTFLSHLACITDATPYEEIKFSVPTTEKQGRVQVTCQKLELSDSSGYLVFFRDVTLEETLQRKYHRELEQKQSYIEDLMKARAELENYSKNLEKMVQERTREITKLNELLGALIDSLDQGFLIFDQTGKVLPVASRACQDTLEIDPRALAIWEVLRLGPEQTESFKKWMKTAFSEMLPFEDLAPLAPSTYSHTRGKTICLAYYPMRDENQAITGVVMVATDQTQLVAAQKQAEQEKAHVSMILKLIKQKRQISKFVGEASKLLLHLEGVLNCPSQPQNEIFRALHTLKGASAFFSIQPVVDACHNAEEQLRWGDLKQCAEWVKVAKVAFQKFLDEAQALIGPLSETEGEKIELRVKDLTEYSQTFLEKGSPSAKEFFRRFLFKQPSEFFKPYNEPLQELAGRLNKSLQPLHVTPPNFSLLCQPYELLFQEFIHAFRNSLDHGIEPPEERIAQGKMPEGQIRIHFEKQHKPPAKPRLKIMIQDDGRGIDPKRVREKLTQKGIHSDHLSDQEVLQFVLSPQFSTKDTVSEISGRGVGLDALTAQVSHLKGRIWVESIPGQGTQIFMELPWIDDLDLSNCLAKAS